MRVGMCAHVGGFLRLCASYDGKGYGCASVQMPNRFCLVHVFVSMVHIRGKLRGWKVQNGLW